MGSVRSPKILTLTSMVPPCCISIISQRSYQIIVLVPNLGGVGVEFKELFMVVKKGASLQGNHIMYNCRTVFFSFMWLLMFHPIYQEQWRADGLSELQIRVLLQKLITFKRALPADTKK